MSDDFLNFIQKMQEWTGYIRIENLKNAYSYKIYARNAYVGIWVENDTSFIISRYKAGPSPYLFHEYHWDTGEPFGTVKPLRLIEKCPFEIKNDYDDGEQQKILQYLSGLEESNPIISGVNSLQGRKQSAVKFAERLKGDPELRSMAKTIGFPVHILEGVYRLKWISKRFIEKMGRSITYSELLEKSGYEESRFNRLFDLLDKQKVKQYLEFRESKSHNKKIHSDK